VVNIISPDLGDKLKVKSELLLAECSKNKRAPDFDTDMHANLK